MLNMFRFGSVGTHFFDSRATVVPLRARRALPGEGRRSRPVAHGADDRQHGLEDIQADGPDREDLDLRPRQGAPREAAEMRDKQWHTPSLDPLRATGARAETRAPRGSPRGSPRARGLTFRTSDLPSQAYYVAQTAPAEFKVRRDPDKTRRAGEREPSGRFPGSRPNRVSFPVVAPLVAHFLHLPRATPPSGLQPRLRRPTALEPERD
jgi:hypothetical protein